MELGPKEEQPSQWHGEGLQRASSTLPRRSRPTDLQRLPGSVPGVRTLGNISICQAEPMVRELCLGIHSPHTHSSSILRPWNSCGQPSQTWLLKGSNLH